MIQFNLLPDIKKEYITAKKTKALVISSAIITTMAAVGLSILFFLYVTFIQQLQISLISGDIKKKSDTLNGVQDLSKYLTIQNQLSALPDLHAQKGAYSRLFTFLPILNPSAPNNVKLTTLQFSQADKTMVFTGSTATFESLNIFVDTLRNAEISYKEPGVATIKKEKMFDSVAVENSVLSRVSNTILVSFTIQTIYKDAVFDIHNDGVTATIPTITTTQSITESPKPQLFESPKPGGQ